MPTVTLENGLKIDFEKAPSPEDVQHVVDTIHTEQKGNSFLQGIVSKYFTARTAYNAVGDENKPKMYDVPDRGVKVSEDDLNTLNHVLMGEVGNRGSDKIDLETRTIANTALNRLKEYTSKGMKVSLADVLKMPNQYQGYMPDGMKKPDGTSSPSQYQMAASGQLDPLSKEKFGKIQQVTNSIRAGDFPDTTSGAFYYQHDPATGEIHYDNSRPLFQK